MQRIPNPCFLPVSIGWETGFEFVAKQEHYKNAVTFILLFYSLTLHLCYKYLKYR